MNPSPFSTVGPCEDEASTAAPEVSDRIPEWESILPDAEALVHGDRGDSYGPPWADYERTVAIFNAITGRDLTAAEGLSFMVAVKLSRLGHGLQNEFPPDRVRDSITDAAGYLDCLWGAINRKGT